MRTPAVVKVKPGQGAEHLTTKQLIRGLYVGYTFVFFEMDAVKELVARGETEALIEAYQKSTRVFVKACIQRNIELPEAMIRARYEARKRGAK